MILQLLKGREVVSGLSEKKRDAIPPHPAPPQALAVRTSSGNGVHEARILPTEHESLSEIQGTIARDVIVRVHWSFSSCFPTVNNLHSSPNIAGKIK
jgi:hypothetical protein